MNAEIATRRRGTALQDAILAAAWIELQDAGYTNFTYEAVARRAETSRPVLYRRWPTKLELALAAIRHHITLNPIRVPDLGDVRSELCVLLRSFADRSPPRLTRLIFDMGEDMAERETSFIDLRENPLAEVLKRAVDRGEVDAAKLTPRVVRLPTSLVLHEIIITQKRISDDAIAEVVDNIFLPLVVAPL